MINVTIYRKHKLGFKVEGHAGYSKHGSDIVCSAVTVLVFNAINSFEAFTKQKFEMDMKDGYISCFFSDHIEKDAKLLFDSMLLGLEHIKQDYKQFITIIDKEVYSDD